MSETTTSPKIDAPISADVPPASRVVTIYIANQPHRISFGKHSGAELRRLAGVPDCDELVQVTSGETTPIAPDAFVLIEGEERFLTYPGSCGSS